MYCLRAVLSALWIAHQKTIPPMELKFLLAEMPDPVLREKVSELVNLKGTKEESYRHKRETDLETFLADGIAECDRVALSLPSKKSNIELLNRFFRNTIHSK
jgi:predicted nucleotidyltransferase